MKSRYFDASKDYTTVASWWKAWNWPIIPLEMLPKTGIIVSTNGKDTCAAWIYKSDSLICWADFYISSKEVKGKDRKGCINFLIQELIREATESGYKLMISSVKKASLINRLQEQGFYAGDTGMINLTRAL